MITGFLIFAPQNRYLVNMIKIAILASGSGTNAQRITEYLRERHSPVTVGMILSNNPEALVLKRAGILGVPSDSFSRKEFYETNRIPDLLREHEIEYIILAGFLWMVPGAVLNAYPDRILNIHPALLPRYGGKGMYGMKVHETVIANQDKESGISIHKVNERYDEGEILFQARCGIEQTDTPESLAEKIHELEYRYFPRVIESYILKGVPPAE
jgi:phosphoribosylglycinamide formyltransferase 1